MRPDTEQALADEIRGANGPLNIRGGGTRGLAVEGQTLETGALSGIRLYEPGALTMVAGAGTPLAEIEAALDAENQMLAFEPYDLAGLTGAGGASTIGGIIATNASGPRRVQAGAARDFLLGVRFVDGSGNIVKNGGRVMKNVTGYDLVKLMAGAHGTLGVLTEVSFKVLPKPERVTSLHLNGLDIDTAIRALSRALGSPFDVTGAVHHLGHEPFTAIRLEGFDASVTYRIEALGKMLSDFGTWTVHDEQPGERTGWAWARDLEMFQGEPGDIWRIGCKPSDAAGLAARLSARDLFFDWGGGRIWAATEPGTDLRVMLGGFDGHATLIRGEGQPRFQPEPAPIARLTAGLRAQFDPRGILNTGLMG